MSYNQNNPLFLFGSVFLFLVLEYYLCALRVITVNHDDCDNVKMIMRTVVINILLLLLYCLQKERQEQCYAPVVNEEFLL